MEWITGVEHLRSQRLNGVIVTVISSRGHAPRRAGAKMVVSADAVWGTVGGGNLEATAMDRARALTDDGSTTPELLTLQLSEKAPAEHGVQCCGGEVTILLEPLRVLPSVAIFGVGHVGLELARILVRHDLELHLIDSRPSMLEPQRIEVLGDGNAVVHVHSTPAPESVIAGLPAGTHTLIMTHDHAEDFILCDTALRNPALGSIGLIGSKSKWTRFTTRLTAEGHAVSDITRITTPIGITGISGKEPAAIAVSVAAGLLRSFELSEQLGT